MSDSRLHTHPPLRAAAFCDYALTDVQFEEYVATADYMSKRKILLGLLLFLIGYFLLAIPFLWAIGFPRGYLLAIIIIFLIPSPAVIIANAKKQPPWWGWGYQVNLLTETYSEALGFPLDCLAKKYRFEIHGDILQFVTVNRTLQAKIEEIRWVEKKGDLIIVGVLSGDKSLLNPLFNSTRPHYKAVPAMVFHASKLEGMDPDELIALLKEYAKKPKRPLPRKDAWK